MGTSNPPIGNNVWEGVLGVVRITFKGIAMGKTTADTTMVVDMDIKDIIFQQNGTKYADKVRTGQAIMINCTFGEITTRLLELIQPGFNRSPGGNSLELSKSLYQSMKDNEGGRLIITRVDSLGYRSTDPLFRIVFYNAMAEITGEIPWGADTQRAVPVTFHCFWDDTNKAFGYSGYASCLNIAA